MARRKRPIEPEAAPQSGASLLTYIGEAAISGVCGYVLPNGVPVEVPEAVALRFASHPQFEVSRGDVHEG